MPKIHSNYLTLYDRDFGLMLKAEAARRGMNRSEFVPKGMLEFIQRNPAPEGQTEKKQ